MSIVGIVSWGGGMISTLAGALIEGLGNAAGVVRPVKESL